MRLICSLALGPLAGTAAGMPASVLARPMAQWDLLMFGVWSDHTQDERNAQTLRELWKTFEPFTKGYYVNTEPSESEQRLRATYGDNYPRLAQLKNKYDPDNLFRLNANIRPRV